MEEEYNNPEVRIRRSQIKAEVTKCVIEQRTKFIEEVTRFHENPNKLPTRFFARYNRNMRLIVYSEEEANLADFERCKNVSLFYYDQKKSELNRNRRQTISGSEAKQVLYACRLAAIKNDISLKDVFHSLVCFVQSMIIFESLR